MSNMLAEKDPADVKDYHIAWGDSTNDASADDDGLLQGDTISTQTWTVPSGITKDSDTVQASIITIEGVSWPADTISTIWVSGGTADIDYTVSCAIVTAQGREYTRRIIIPVRTL